MSYIVLLYQDYLYHTEMETPGTLSIGSGKKDTLHIDGMEQAQITIKENKKGVVQVNAKGNTPFFDNDVSKDVMIVLSEEQQVALYITDEVSEAAETLKLPYNCIVKFGRTDKNQVTLASPYVSSHHFTLRNEAGTIRIEDNNSTNGLYLNGKRVSKAKIHSGDVISIVHMNIRLVNNELFFENVGNCMTIHGIEEEHAIGGQARKEYSGEGTIKYRRSPRTQEQLPSTDIVLASAPSAGSKYEKRKGIFSSFLGTGAMFAANLATGGVASPALLAARAASLVSPITSIASQTGGEKQRKSKLEEYEQLRMEKYGQYIAEQKARIESVATVQREVLTRENPSAVECLENLKKLNRSLWERGPADRDFLDVRLGMGYEELCVQVKSREDGGFRMENDEVKELAEQIVEETRIVDNIPARLSLKQYRTVSVIGNRYKVISQVKNMLVSLTTAHCFDEVHIVGIFDEREKEQWEALKWLPHVWDENRQYRFLAFSKERAQELCVFFNDVLKSRVKDGEGGYNKKSPLPHYIFLLGSRAYTEKEEIMNLLTSNAPDLGVTTLFLFDDLYNTPHSCQFIVDVDNGPCAYVRNEVNNKFFYTMDTSVTEGQFDSYARQMSAIELEGISAQAEIPQGISFLEGYGVSRVEQLGALQRWQNSQPYKSLSAPLGVMGGEKIFSLDIHEKFHGPHGLVAGTTGSGKSELLQSWILSMAVNYHPHDVSFVIIDYKGGGMANLLEGLPHVVGKITNIGSNIGRSLVSLRSEMKRRQRIFDEYSEYGVNHIDKYQKLYREGKAKEPLPHLVIVADEFAELKQNEPEFMSGLVSAARIGRSLGVHLVLATQKPSGVVDEQIQSNSKFRLCLKVQSAGDSREMIRRPDAARITQAGRSYVLVGEDEVFELFQSYWSGAPYRPDATEVADSGNPVSIVDISGTRRKLNKKVKKVASDMDELKAVSQYLNRVMLENGIRKLDGPWLPELPTELVITDLKVPGGFDGNDWRGTLPWLKVPVGMYDAPALQAQGIQFIDFVEEGHYGIYGAPSTGKTTLLKSIVCALGYYYSPQDVNIYIMDFGGWGLNVFSRMPHVGGIALDFEEEKIMKLQQMLLDEINVRKKKFLSAGVSSLTAYRQAKGGGMPAIVLAIDNLVPIFDNYPDLENFLVTIARDGATYGIYMIYTANSTTGVRYKVLQNIRGAIAFELTDKGDYAAIVGRLDGMVLPKITGRAFFKGKSPIEMQAAMYMDGETEAARSEKLKAMCATMDSVWDGYRPDIIPVMPEELSFEEVFKNYGERCDVPMGIAYDSIRPVMSGMQERYNLLISGTMNSGKSRYLVGLATSIHKKRPEDKIYVFDSQRGALKATETFATRYAQTNQTAAVETSLAEIVEMLNVRKRAQNQAKSMAGNAFSEEEFIADYEQICIFIDDLKEFVDEVEDSSKNSMERICRLAQGLGVLVFVAGRVADIERYNEIENLTRAIVGNQKGIGLGGCAAIHTFFRNDLSYKEKEQEAGAGNGFWFDEGHCIKVKLPQ